jgi:hypothetical protein
MYNSDHWKRTFKNEVLPIIEIGIKSVGSDSTPCANCYSYGDCGTHIKYEEVSFEEIKKFSILGMISPGMTYFEHMECMRSEKEYQNMYANWIQRMEFFIWGQYETASI